MVTLAWHASKYKVLKLHPRYDNNGVCRVVKIVMAESNLDMELLTQQTFCFSPNVLSKLAVVTMAIVRSVLLYVHRDRTDR